MNKWLKLIFIFGIFLSISSVKVFSEDSIDQLQKQIDEYTNKLTELSKTKNTLANQIKIIDSQVQLTLLKINQTQVSIKTLEKDIADLTVKIGDLDVSLNQLSELYLNQVTQNYKLSKRIPNMSLIFASSNFNHFLEEYKYLTMVQKSSQDTLVSMETVRTTFNQEKTAKKDKQKELELLKTKLNSQQISLNNQKTAKAQLLIVTNNDEKKYQQLLTDAQNQLRLLRNFSSTAGGSACLSSSPGSGNDGNFYSQRDPGWCKQIIGNSNDSSDTIGAVGCYISSISMVYKKLGFGTTPSIYATDPLKFVLNTAYARDPIPPSGYTYKKVSYSPSTINSEFSAGRYVIAELRMGSGQHFIVLINGANGNYKMHDPWYGPDLDFSSHYSSSQIISLRLITK